MSSRTDVPSRKDEKITLKVKDELLLFPQNEIVETKQAFVLLIEIEERGREGMAWD